MVVGESACALSDQFGSRCERICSHLVITCFPHTNSRSVVFLNIIKLCLVQKNMEKLFLKITIPLLRVGWAQLTRAASDLIQLLAPAFTLILNSTSD